jgi:hypothetical protein
MRKAILAMAKRILGHVYHSIRRIMQFLGWVFPALQTIVLLNKKRSRRLLVVYDLSCQSFSVGDFLTIQEASLVLREMHNLDSVDFALVVDPQHPATRDPAFASFTEKNAMYHLASVLPVAQVNPYLGSLFAFDSHAKIDRYIADNIDFYHSIWPTAWKNASHEYLNDNVLNKLLNDYYKAKGSIPILSCRQFLMEWAQSFYAERVRPSVPVTVQIGNNKAFSTSRDMRLESWYDFFRYCEKQYPVKFVAICTFFEIDDRLRVFPNVIVAKDFHTSIEQDLSLISTAPIHMGASSGLGVIALFGKKPFLNVAAIYNPKDYRGMIQEGPFVRFCFGGTLQRFVIVPETTELLIEEFAKMWATVVTSEWTSVPIASDKPDAAAHTWLR